MAWTGLTLTVDGRNALNQAQMNNRLCFKAIVIGDGNPPGNFGTQKSLVHPLYELTDLKVDMTEEGCALTADFPEVNADYYFREIGVIVATEDGDKLYVYDNCGDDAQYIVSTTGAERTQKRIRLYLTISDVADVAVSAPAILYVDYDEYENAVTSLEQTISTKAGQAETESALAGKLDKTGDAKDTTVTFASADVADGGAGAWTSVGTLSTGEKLGSVFNKVSMMFKNIRYLYKMLGTTNISAIGGGTVTGAISKLNTDLWKYSVFTFTATPIEDNYSWGGYLINGNIDLELKNATVLALIPLRCESKITSRRKGILTVVLEADGSMNYGADVNTGDTYEMAVGLIYKN